MYEFLASLTLIIHFLFILFVIFGGLLFFFRKWMVLLHIPALLYGVYVELTQLICPLTYLENFLLLKANVTTCSTGFIQNYLMPIIYPISLNKDLQINLAISLIILNLIIYGIILIKRNI